MTREDARPTRGEPDSSTERVLAGIWRRALLVDQVGLTDNFLLLGGDSIAATLCLIDIRRTFDVEMPYELLLSETASLERIAAHIDETVGRAEAARAAGRML